MGEAAGIVETVWIAQINPHLLTVSSRMALAFVQPYPWSDVSLVKSNPLTD
jgi:hypothetical protein